MSGLAALVVAVGLLPGVAAAGPGGPTGRETLLNYLYGFSNGRTVSGQHHKPEVYGTYRSGWSTYWSDYVRQVTGEQPGLWGADFLWYSHHRPELTAAAERASRAGSLVTLTWHSCRPKIVAGDCRSGASGTPDEKLTDAEWTELLTDGAPLNLAWRADLDVVAGSLAALRDQGVSVLWRPLHEINDAWSWWGGRGAQSRRLYEMMHEHFDARQLTNLVWVWNVTDRDPAGFRDYLPADEYVDVLSEDVWNKGTTAGRDEPSAAEYQTLVELAKGRPIALGEVKKVPSPALLAAQPRWSWFMLWPDPLENQPTLNSPAVLRQTYGSESVLNRQDLSRPTPAEPGADLAAGRPVWAKTSENDRLDARWVVDGDNRTRWSSAYADDQWIYVELAAPAVVRTVRLDWEAAFPAKYQIQLSADGKHWRTSGADLVGSAGVRDVTITDPAPVRYVKVYAWQRATPYGYSLWSLGVYL